MTQPCDPRTFFEVAQELVTRASSGEAYCRTAVSRAYYSCFLLARDRQFGRDGVALNSSMRKRLTTGKGGIHEAVVQAIVKNRNISSMSKAKRISDQLAEMKDLRVQADYVMDSASINTKSLLTKYQVSDWLGLTEVAMSLASNLVPEVSRLPTFK